MKFLASKSLEKFFDSGMYFRNGNVNNVIVFLEDKERDVKETFSFLMTIPY